MKTHNQILKEYNRWALITKVLNAMFVTFTLLFFAHQASAADTQIEINGCQKKLTCVKFDTQRRVVAKAVTSGTCTIVVLNPGSMR